jgi:hypothetical protein
MYGDRSDNRTLTLLKESGVLTGAEWRLCLSPFQILIHMADFLESFYVSCYSGCEFIVFLSNFQ